MWRSKDLGGSNPPVSVNLRKERSMRWKNKQPGILRIRKGFLFLPREIGDEWRWLERAVWQERFCRDTHRGREVGYWEDLNWIDEPRFEVGQ